MNAPVLLSLTETLEKRSPLVGERQGEGRFLVNFKLRNDTLASHTLRRTIQLISNEYEIALLQLWERRRSRQ
mgnify:FL=1